MGPSAAGDAAAAGTQVADGWSSVRVLLIGAAPVSAVPINSAGIIRIYRCTRRPRLHWGGSRRKVMPYRSRLGTNYPE